MTQEELNKFDYIVGIDEVGRGSIAGPLVVGAVLLEKSDYFKIDSLIKGINDSKLVTEKERSRIASEINQAGFIIKEIASVSAPVIDKIKMGKALHLAVKKVLEKLDIEIDKTLILLDGRLSAPKLYQQISIIKGDQKEKIIGMASIIAKVYRDNYMIKLAKKFPKYEFQAHKGYGTELHYERLRKYKSDICHRQTFLPHSLRRRRKR